jgi:hypothetical protein
LEIDRTRDERERKTKHDQPVPGRGRCCGDSWTFPLRAISRLRPGLGDRSRGTGDVGGSILLDRSDEPVAFAGDRLDETRLLRIVPQDQAELPDRGVDTVVHVNENFRAPDSFDDLLARDELSPPFDQHEEQFHRDALEFESAAGATELVGAEVELENPAESDGPGNPGWIEFHGQFPGAGSETVTRLRIRAQIP